MEKNGILREIFRPWETIRRVKRLQASIPHLFNEIDSSKRENKFLTGQLAARTIPHFAKSLAEAEFQVFSQFSEDGIIQYLIKQIPSLDKSFVEFGVQSYQESNTLFLLMNNSWRGLVLDGEQQYIDSIRQRDFRWKFGLDAKCAFVSRDNINDLFREAGFGTELGLLSIDVDGIDWHLWDALTIVKPGIVIVEYNRVFPLNRPVTVPYEPLFDRTSKHPSMWYYGTSLAALHHLAIEKGYTFVGVESHRRNAFFVRSDLMENLQADELREVYVDRDAEKVMDRLKGMPVYNVRTRTAETL